MIRIFGLVIITKKEFRSWITPFYILNPLKFKVKMSDLEVKKRRKTKGKINE